MSDGATTPLRVIAFADPEGRLWGGAVDDGSSPVMVLGATGGPLSAGDERLALDATDDEWRLTGAGIDLTVTPSPGDGGDIQLCDVSGTVSAAGGDVVVQCPAIRTTGRPDGRLGSVRAVAGWFGGELAFGLEALRPARAQGHESDRIRAALFEAGSPVIVDEGRLSTTVHEDGVPARTSLELWVGDGEDLYPRRAAGEARGPSAQGAAGALRLAGVPLRCHAAGLDGTGVYLVAHRS